MQTKDKIAIEKLIGAFFSNFTNRQTRPELAAIHAQFIKQAIIIKNTGQNPEIYTLEEFIIPRARLLTDGTLTDFEEKQISGRTEIYGNLAQHTCTYYKTGNLTGQRFETRGMKIFHLIRTLEGWRISAVAWDDEREDFRVPDSLN